MKKVTIKKIMWSDAAEKALGNSLGEYATTIRNEVNQNISELFFSPEFGYLVTRLEMRPEGKEFVLVAGSGQNLMDIVPVFCEIGKAAAARLVRVHTPDWRVAKLFEAVEFELLERVYIKRL